MKEAVGESAMTIITIVLVAGAVGAAALIISNLLTGQKKRTACENSGAYWSGGKCMCTDTVEAILVDEEYTCS